MTPPPSPAHVSFMSILTDVEAKLRAGGITAPTPLKYDHPMAQPDGSVKMMPVVILIKPMGPADTKFTDWRNGDGVNYGIGQITYPSNPGLTVAIEVNPPAMANLLTLNPPVINVLGSTLANLLLPADPKNPNPKARTRPAMDEKGIKLLRDTYGQTAKEWVGTNPDFKPYTAPTPPTPPTPPVPPTP